MKRPQDYTVRIDWQATSRDYGLHILVFSQIGTQALNVYTKKVVLQRDGASDYIFY